jgi:NADH-quinone oxidoreductase subunit G
VQSFYAAVNPLGEARPGWKVLRVLGSLLGLPGFAFDNVAEVRAACLGNGDIASRLANRVRGVTAPARSSVSGIQRIADVPAYFADPLARRSPPLQKTRQARAPTARMSAGTLEKLGLSAGQPVLVQGKARLEAALDAAVPDDCVRIAAAHPSSVEAGPMFGTITLEKLQVERAA